MMNSKQYRMLELLKDGINRCELCSLHTGGRCNPYFTEEAKYAILGEAPGRNEVEQNTPFIGIAGKHLWTIMNEYGFRREEFLIVNCVNCRPVDGKKNGKPTIEQIETCRDWVRKFIKVLEPKAIISLGNYAMYHTYNNANGILSINSRVIQYYGISTVLSVHPSLCIYRGEEGKKLLSESVKKLAEVVER